MQQDMKCRYPYIHPCSCIAHNGPDMPYSRVSACVWVHGPTVADLVAVWIPFHSLTSAQPNLLTERAKASPTMGAHVLAHRTGGTNSVVDW